MPFGGAGPNQMMNTFSPGGPMGNMPNYQFNNRGGMMGGPMRGGHGGRGRGGNNMGGPVMPMSMGPMGPMNPMMMATMGANMGGAMNMPGKSTSINYL